MPDTYKDLTTLAAKAETNGGAGFLVRTRTVWSYPGAPRDASTRLPKQSVDHARVQAALGDGLWVGCKFDISGEVDMVCPADSPAAKRPGGPVSALDVGTVRAVFPE